MSPLFFASAGWLITVVLALGFAALASYFRRRATEYQIELARLRTDHLRWVAFTAAEQAAQAKAWSRTQIKLRREIFWLEQIRALYNLACPILKSIDRRRRKQIKRRRRQSKQIVRK